jgi:chromosome segregation ATPase
MPSQQVIDKLQDTQRELDKIKSAVEHIQDAAAVVQKASHVVLEVQKLIKELQSIEKDHRFDLIKILKERIGEIERQIEASVKELDKGVKQLGQLIKINFPERLDKIDNQISSINIGIQNLQGDVRRLQDKIEFGFSETKQIVTRGFSKTNDNITESIAVISDEIEKSGETVVVSINNQIDKKISGLIEHIESENQLLRKELKTNRIIQIATFIILAGMLVYIFMYSTNSRG